MNNKFNTNIKRGLHPSLICIIIVVLSIFPFLPFNAYAQSNNLVRIAVILPFKAHLSEGPRSLEFYRGLLLAAELQKSKGVNLQIAAYDEGSPDTDITDILQEAHKNSDLLIGFFYRNHILSAGDFCKNNGKNVYFPFASFVPLELQKNPACYFPISTIDQFIAIESRLVFDKTGKSNIICVIPNPQQKASSETLELTASLKKRGCKIRYIQGAASLTELENKLNPKTHNILIIDSQTPQELISPLSHYAEYHQKHPTQNLSILGNKTWMEFYDELMPYITGIDLYIPTHWFAYTNLSDIEPLKDLYRSWFHCNPLPSQPSSLFHAYDFAERFITPTNNDAYSCARQHIFNMKFSQHHNGDCWTNEGIRLFHVLKEGTCELIEFKH